MSIWIGLDFESTGLDPTKDVPIEAAAVFYDSREKRVIHSFSSMLKNENIDSIPEEVHELTGISKKILRARHYDFESFASSVSVLAMECGPSYWIGHNINDYDMPMLKASFKRQNLDLEKEIYSHFNKLLDLPYIDTMVDVPFPKKIKTRKLEHLAAEHGFLNLMSHSALADVLATIRIASMYDAVEIERSAASPMVLVRSQAPFEQKDEVKALGFYFDGKKKAWFKRMRLDSLKNCQWNFAYSIVESADERVNQEDPF